MRGENHRTGRLSGLFNFIATAAAGAAVLALVAQSGTMRHDALQRELGQNIDDVCVRARDHRPPRAANDNTAPLTAGQVVLVRLLRKMDETGAGQAMNRSAAAHDVIWCMENAYTHYGSYTSGALNVATLSAPLFGGVEKLSGDRVTFNRALRTMYEENAHAWQNHEQNVISPPFFAAAADKITWRVALESAARVSAFTALHQHRLAGDAAPWNDNARDRKNGHIMARMNLAWRADPAAANPAAQWAGFDAFYDDMDMMAAYQLNAADDSFLFAGGNALGAERFRAMGTVPGMNVNYLAGTGFDPRAPRYGEIIGKSLRERVESRTTKASVLPLRKPE